MLTDEEESRGESNKINALVCIECQTRAPAKKKATIDDKKDVYVYMHVY